MVAVAALYNPANAEPTSEDVRTAQQALQSLGYSPGKADGIMGARTKAAFRKFQRKEGLQVTGEPDQATMHALGFPDPAEPVVSPTPQPASADTNSGSGGGLLLFLVLVGAVVVFVLVKLSKGTRPAPENATWIPRPAEIVAPTYSRPVEQTPAIASMSVFVTPVQPTAQLIVDAPAATMERSEEVPLGVAVHHASDIATAQIGEISSDRASPEPALSAETARLIAEHNQRVSASIAGRLSAISPKIEAAAKADTKSVEVSPNHASSEPTLSPETARLIAEHNKRVSASIVERSFADSRRRIAAAIASRSEVRPTSPMRPEANVKPQVLKSEPSPALVLERTRLQIDSNDHFWIPASQVVTIGEFQIPSGMLYIGRKLRTQNGSVENCLIDPSQYVANTNPDTAGQGMPYWPSYSSISPQCRLAYLQWLAAGKCDPGACIGYVFLYFYGLERRLILDNPGNEAADLIAEVERLLGIYGDNHSFRGYATKLIEAAKFKSGGVPSSIEPVLGARGNELPLSIRAGVGHQLAAGKAIDADWMLAWYTASPERYLRTAATRCEKEFVALFRKRFAAKYPEGMKVTAPRRRLSCGYQAASATFSVALQGPLSDLPDIVALSAPLTAIDPIITSCMDDLAPYSRLIGRDPESRNTLRAAALLPADLDDNASGPMAQLSAFLEDLARAPAATVSLDILLSKLGVKTTEKGRIPKFELVMISDALARCGFAVEPDPLSAGNVLKGADKAVLFRAQAGARIDAAKPSYMAARTLVDIGALVATADGVFSGDEVQAIEGEIVRDPDLSEPERIRLLAYLAFLSKNPPSTRILTRFKDQPQEKRQALARLAVSVAAADGRLATDEVKLLEKIYRVLGLADGALYSDLQSFAASDEALPTVALADHEPSVAIPQPESRDRGKGIRLDPARLARTRTDTAKVSEILADVFSDDAPQVVEETVSTAEPANDEGPITACIGWDLSGLSAPYARLLNELKGRDSISRADFVAMAQKQNVLADGAIETINDWAIERFDEPLIDEGDPIEIGFHLLVENKQDAA